MISDDCRGSEDFLTQKARCNYTTLFKTTYSDLFSECLENPGLNSEKAIPPSLPHDLILFVSSALLHPVTPSHEISLCFGALSRPTPVCVCLCPLIVRARISFSSACRAQTRRRNPPGTLCLEKFHQCESSPITSISSDATFLERFSSIQRVLMA